MKMRTLAAACVLAVVLLICLSTRAAAQDRNRYIRPAFPIGTGEKMLVIPGVGMIVANVYEGTSAFTIGLDFTYLYIIDLPVGTTLKRILGDFVDKVGPNMVISLVRHSNTAPMTAITLRSFDTSGISSANGNDYKQIVGNPLNHTMLQGWTYMILVDFPGGTNDGDLSIGAIKLIYEP